MVLGTASVCLVFLWIRVCVDVCLFCCVFFFSLFFGGGLCEPDGRCICSGYLLPGQVPRSCELPNRASFVCVSPMLPLELRKKLRGPGREKQFRCFHGWGTRRTGRGVLIRKIAASRGSGSCRERRRRRRHMTSLRCTWRAGTLCPSGPRAPELVSHAPADNRARSLLKGSKVGSRCTRWKGQWLVYGSFMAHWLAFPASGP